MMTLVREGAVAVQEALTTAANTFIEVLVPAATEEHKGCVQVAAEIKTCGFHIFPVL
jgi:hypothetical protein